MKVDDKLRLVKKYVEYETCIEDISIEKKTNELVFARCIYYMICMKHIHVHQDRCARLVGKDHVCLIHAKKKTEPGLPTKFVRIADDFNPNVCQSPADT